MTTIDVGWYNIRNRCNNLQPVPTRIFYPAPLTSKIQKDCKLFLSTQQYRHSLRKHFCQKQLWYKHLWHKYCQYKHPWYKFSWHKYLQYKHPQYQYPWYRYFRQNKQPRLRKVTSNKNVTSKEVPSNTQKTITSDNDVISEEVLSNTQVFNSNFVNEIKDLSIKKTHKKSRPIVQARNDNKNLALTQSPKLQRAYI